jgi:hypothetical protein
LFGSLGPENEPQNIECRILNNDGRQKKEEWILIFTKQLDRINRIERPSAEGRLAAGEKNPVNPVNPV